MNRGRTVFAQLLEFIPFGHFEHLVDRFAANRGVSEFTAWSHLLCMTYAQLTRQVRLAIMIWIPHIYSLVVQSSAHDNANVSG